jgi:hypothetical protein
MQALKVGRRTPIAVSAHLVFTETETEGKSADFLSPTSSALVFTLVVL